MSTPRNIWDWLRRQFVDDVPEGDALCEFDCRKLQCTEEEWKVCDRRLHHAAGELMPEKAPVAEPVAQPTEVSKSDAAEQPLPKV
jgi:hypothetical protein